MSKETKKHIQRFLKDYKLPIQVYKEPYFSYYLKALDPYFNSLEKYALFEKTYKDFNDPEKFVAFGSKLVNLVVDHVKAKPEFQLFNTNPDYHKNLEFETFNGKNLYIVNHKDKRFFSIDLVKANYRSLYFVNPQILDGKNTYEEFFSQFENRQYFVESKQIRQAIFGNLNPKRQQTIQKHLISKISKSVQKLIPKENLRALSSDEIIISAEDYSLEKLLEVLGNDLQDQNLNMNHLRVEEFNLRKFEDHDYYWKEFSNGKIQFRQVPGPYTFEVIKKFEGKPLHEYDKVFVQDRRLVQFLEPLFGEE